MAAARPTRIAHRADDAATTCASGSTPRARPASRRARCICTPICGSPPISMPPPMLGLTENDVCYSVAKLFFAYGLGNAHDLPDVGRRHHGAAAGPADARRRRRDLLREHPVTVFYAVPTFYAAFLASPSAPQRARAEAALLRLGRRGAAARRRPALEASATASTSSTASARPRCCTSSSPTAPAT